MIMLDFFAGSEIAVMEPDFFDGSTTGATEGLIALGGSGPDFLRASGSTGETICADCFSPASELEIAEVLLGVSGREAVGDGVIGGMTGGTVEVVWRGAQFSDGTGGGRTGAGGSGLAIGIVGASGGGALGVIGTVAAWDDGRAVNASGGGLIEGARIGADFATGSGMLGEPDGVTSIGGATLASGGGWTGRGADATRGGWGASGSGTRAAGADGEVAGSGGIVVGAVSARPDVLFWGIPTVSLVIAGSVPVTGSAGGRVRNSMGATSESWSVLPLTKTLACGLAMMTRGGATGTRPDAVGTRPVATGGRPGGVAGAGAVSGAGRPGTMPVSAGAAPVLEKTGRIDAVFEPGRVGGADGRGLAGVGRTSGSVLARDPVSDDDWVSWDGAGPTRPVGGRPGFCIGWVTAVDHGGVTVPVPAGAPGLI
jgi:hypothetical protein